MSLTQFVKQKIQSAIETFFDNTNTDFEATNVQEALVEIGASASPGFGWGGSGNITNGSWLLNEGVPSNRSGRNLFLVNPEISQIFTSSENLDTYDISIYEHEGDEINLSLLATVSIVSSRSESFTVSINASQGRQLAVRLSSGSAKNVIVGVIVKGST